MSLDQVDEFLSEALELLTFLFHAFLKRLDG